MKLDQEHIEFLDELRDSGVTNMFAAGPYLQQEFFVDKYEARDILAQWMGYKMREEE